jgi:hypothetical protein
MPELDVLGGGRTRERSRRRGSTQLGGRAAPDGGRAGSFVRLVLVTRAGAAVAASLVSLELSARFRGSGRKSLGCHCNDRWCGAFHSIHSKKKCQDLRREIFMRPYSARLEI